MVKMSKNEEERVCSGCRRKKEDGIAGFVRNGSYERKDGTVVTKYLCRKCRREYEKKYYKKNRERICKTTRERTTKQQINAHNAVKKAINAGDLERPDECPECGDDAMTIHAHHEDYSNPLDVEWLCPSCHMRLHESQD